MAKAIPSWKRKRLNGYVLNSDPVYFDVTPENAVSEDGIVLVIAEKEMFREGTSPSRKPASCSPP